MAKNPTSFKIMDEKRNCHEETIVLDQLINNMKYINHDYIEGSI